jgi:hypothetical protein
MAVLTDVEFRGLEIMSTTAYKAWSSLLIPKTKKLFKRKVSRDGYFLFKHVEQFLLSVDALMVFKVFKSLSLPFTIITFLYASLKLLTNIKNA